MRNREGESFRRNAKKQDKTYQEFLKKVQELVVKLKQPGLWTVLEKDYQAEALYLGNKETVPKDDAGFAFSILKVENEELVRSIINEWTYEEYRIREYLRNCGWAKNSPSVFRVDPKYCAPLFFEQVSRFHIIYSHTTDSWTADENEAVIRLVRYFTRLKLRLINALIELQEGNPSLAMALEVIATEKLPPHELLIFMGILRATKGSREKKEFQTLLADQIKLFMDIEPFKKLIGKNSNFHKELLPCFAGLRSFLQSQYGTELHRAYIGMGDPDKKIVVNPGDSEWIYRNYGEYLIHDGNYQEEAYYPDPLQFIDRLLTNCITLLNTHSTTGHTFQVRHAKLKRRVQIEGKSIKGNNPKEMVFPPNGVFVKECGYITRNFDPESFDFNPWENSRNQNRVIVRFDRFEICFKDVE